MTLDAHETFHTPMCTHVQCFVFACPADPPPLRHQLVQIPISEAEMGSRLPVDVCTIGGYFDILFIFIFIFMLLLYPLFFFPK